DDYVVTDVNLEIEEGEFFVIIGPSGSGKTTMLKMINRLIPLSKGTIYVKDQPISDYNIQELRWNMGYVLQQIALFPNMTVEENIRTVPEMKNWSEEEMDERVTSLLNSVGLDAESYRNRKTGELSGGEQQRIGVLRAFAADPDIILMDEPFSSLDPISRKSLQNDVIKMHKENNKTIVFVTHDMQEAILLGSRIALMEEGEIVQKGTTEEIIHAPKNEFVKNFLKSGNIQENDFDKVESLVDEGYLLEFESQEELSSSLYKEDSLNDLILKLSDQEAVLIKNNEEEVLGKLDKKTLVSYLAEGIEKRGEVE
ncbi:MAG: ABC transporter ATP-binding protein, partial [Atopostipes sp.]|nr:ABC transporter ATP-binding protein [Atopostipes sp.]